MKGTISEADREVDRMLQSVLIGVAVIFVISLLKSSLRF
jgi:hypothetical protein